MPERSGSAAPGLQAGVGQGQQGGGHAHLALPAHHLQPLADGLLLLLLQRAEIVDLAAELPGLGAEADGQVRVPSAASASSPTPLRPAKSASHSASGVLPSGQITPIPVITVRRLASVMHSPIQLSAVSYQLSAVGCGQAGSCSPTNLLDTNPSGGTAFSCPTLQSPS